MRNQRREMTTGDKRVDLYQVGIKLFMSKSSPPFKFLDYRGRWARSNASSQSRARFRASTSWSGVIDAAIRSRLSVNVFRFSSLTVSAPPLVTAMVIHLYA